MVALDKTPHSAPKFQALMRDARASSPLFREVESAYTSSHGNWDRNGNVSMDTDTN